MVIVNPEDLVVATSGASLDNPDYEERNFDKLGLIEIQNRGQITKYR